MSSFQQKKIIILGPAHPLRGGGITTFNQRLAKQFQQQGHDCSIWSFSLQYPSFLFPGKSQYTTEPPPEGIKIKPVINSINPVNWWLTGKKLKKEKPDIIVVRFWLPFMGPCMGTICRIARRNNHTRIICIADNIIPHEKRPGDKLFTRYFLKSCDAFITMSEKVKNDLMQFISRGGHSPDERKIMLVPHPLYDNFGTPITKEEARTYLGIPAEERIILFFGFIRKYKGLDILLEAMKMLKGQFGEQPGLVPKLLVAGEFYEEEKIYQDLIDALGIGNLLYLKTGFIADREVKYFLCASDLIVQPYRHATQSGVTPLAYHFEKPMVVTNVGGLPSLVPHEKAGLVAEPNPAGLAKAIARYYELGEEHFVSFLAKEKMKYDWSNMVEAILTLGETAGHQDQNS